MKSRWRVAAIVAPAVLLGYELVLDFVDLFPWNDLSAFTPEEQLLGMMVNHLPLLLIAAAFVQSRPVFQLVAVATSWLYFLGHIAAWWFPYFVGASAETMQESARLYRRTVTFLPAILDHPIPNAAHVVLGLLVFVTGLCATMAAIATWQHEKRRRFCITSDNARD